jgi:hypothetical protein
MKGVAYDLGGLTIAAPYRKFAVLRIVRHKEDALAAVSGDV